MLESATPTPADGRDHLLSSYVYRADNAASPTPGMPRCGAPRPSALVGFHLRAGSLNVVAGVEYAKLPRELDGIGEHDEGQEVEVESGVGGGSDGSG